MAETGGTTFTAMRDATRRDDHETWLDGGEFLVRLPDRISTQLRLLEGDSGGYPVDRLTHSLQSDTRAQRVGRDDEYPSSTSSRWSAPHSRNRATRSIARPSPPGLAAPTPD